MSNSRYRPSVKGVDVIRRPLYASAGAVFLLSSFGLTAHLIAQMSMSFVVKPLNLLALVGAVFSFGLLWVSKHRSEILAQYVITYFHELGHGCAVALTGGTPERFVLRLDGSGYLAHRSRKHRLTRSIIAFAGYPYPAIVAFSGAALHVAGFGYLWILAIAISAGSIAVLSARNIWAFLIAVLLTVLAGYAYIAGTPSVLSLLLGCTVGVLLRGGYESAYKHLLITRDGVPDLSDGAQLGSLLPGSAEHWAWLQLVSIVVLTVITFAVLCGGAVGVITALT